MIPQPVAILLAEARRREDKRTAKRVANRKSACTSRARKKALVEEMTKTNARLRRQALILALLPDLVVAINIDGTITFCSAQVERVLRHSIDDLIGANLMDILLPQSKEALRRLIAKLVAAEKVALEAANNKEGNGNGSAADESNGNISAISSCAPVVSEQSFPPSVVKVKNHHNAENDDVSDSSGNNNGNGNKATTTSSVTNLSLMRSPTNSSIGNHSSSYGDEDPGSGTGGGAQAKVGNTSQADESGLSNLHKASEALNRNVRWHNKKMWGEKIQGCSHTDDVTGASVTANNSEARLSSLQHHPFLSQPGNHVLSSSATGKLGKKVLTATSEGSSTKRKAPDPSPLTLTFKNIEEQSSSSSDSLVSGVEEKLNKPSPERNGVPRRNAEMSSEDSGYRESGESAPSSDDTSSSASDASSNNRADGTLSVLVL